MTQTTSQEQLNQLYVQTIQHIRTEIYQQGLSTIRQIRKYFQRADISGNFKIEKDEFVIGLKEAKVNLNNMQQQLLFAQFDTNRDGHIDFQEFVNGLIGPLQENRRELIIQAFKKYSNIEGYVCIRDLRGHFNSHLHPKVQQGKKTEQEVFEEFIQNFNETHRDGFICLEEWINYYHAVSSSIQSDENFARLLSSAWQL